MTDCFLELFDLLLINSRCLAFEVLEAVFHRSSRPEVFCTTGILKNLAKLTVKHLCQSLFFNKVADLRPAKHSGTGVFSRIFKIFSNTFFTEQLHWLLLKFISHHTKELLYVNTNFMGNKPWSKNKHFLLFLILMLKKPVFYAKLKLLRNKF